MERGHQRKLAQEHSDCLEENSCHAYGDALRLSPRKNPSGTSTAGRLQLATVLPVGQWKHSEFPFQFHLTQLQTSPTMGIPQIPLLCQGPASAFVRVSDKLFICRTREVYPARQWQSHLPEKRRGLGQEMLSRAASRLARNTSASERGAPDRNSVREVTAGFRSLFQTRKLSYAVASSRVTSLYLKSALLD